MYPREFRPSTLCKINDDRGHELEFCELQVFKPLLGCSFNGQQPLIVDHRIPNMAGIVLRGLVRHPLPTVLDIRPGPAFWASGLVPWIVLSEDPNALRWRFLDAIPWNVGASSRLWSFFAAVDHVPPPPPPPPVPITLGATSGAAALITPGTTYVATIPPGAAGWAYSPQATGTAYSVASLVGTNPSVGTAAYGGSHLLVPVLEGGPVPSPGTVPVAGVTHVGPDAMALLSNPLLVPVSVTFVLTLP